MAREPKHIARSQGKASASADPASEPPEGAGGTSSDLEHLLDAIETVAALILKDTVYDEIFERLEDEITSEKAALSQSIVDRARALLRQKAIGDSKSLNISSDAPSP